MHILLKPVFAAFLFLFFISLASHAQQIQSIGVPYVQNYSKLAYKAGNQNWSIVKDGRGVMYFGNSEGLLAFDGNNWQLFQTPNQLIIRAVAADRQGKVYTGGFGEFGYWDYDEEGKFTYTSLVELVRDEVVAKDEIWKIYVDGKRVIFQSFACIYIYENGRINLVRADKPFLFLFKVQERLFVEVISEGLFELQGTALVHIQGSEQLGASGVLSILPFGGQGYLIGTAKKGLYLFDGQTIRPWENQANDFLKAYQLNNAVVMQGNYYAFGTILNGIVILDERGKVVQQINRTSGLQNNTVLSLYMDNEHNLWAGLDNGIDRVEVNSPLYFYFDKEGRFGTVYSSIIHAGNIYLGTNQGIYYSDWPNSTGNLFQAFDFKLIPDSQGQVWDLSLIDGQLLCGHNAGTFRISGTGIRKISDVNGGWTIKKLPSNPAYLIQGTYTGLVLYKKDGKENWVFSHRIAGYVEPSRYVEQDNTGYIWVSHAYRGLYRLKLSEDLAKVVETRNFDKEQGLPDNFNVNIFRLNNRIVFSSKKGFFTYDDIVDRFLPYVQLNERLGAFASSNKIISATEEAYWLISQGKVALAEMPAPGKLSLNATQFSILNGRMVQYYENISRISDSLYLISIDEGFVIYNTKTQLQRLKEAVPKVLIRRVENITDSVTTISEHNASLERKIEIPHSANNIRFSYALPYYSQASIRFQYFLEGYSTKWSEWSHEAQKEFTNLNYGEYRFMVRASINETDLSEVTTFEFTVLPPWYATRLAFLLYVIWAVGVAFLLKRLYQMKLKREKELIQRKLEQEKEEYLRNQKLETEQRLVKLKNEQLQHDLASKSRELSNSALSIVSKNELLQTIKDEVTQLHELTGKNLPKDQYKKIQKIIAGGMSDEQDWQLFERSFNEAHENYFKKLKTNHPELTPNDLKLCAYLRMNMNSKEIASLLNITVRGVELRRYRLRKRLNLEHDKNLTEYLLEV